MFYKVVIYILIFIETFSKSPFHKIQHDSKPDDQT